MKENNLLASIALFSELYNNEKYNSVADIIAEFIKGAIARDNKWSISSTELRDLLKRTYDFDLPESVLRTTINLRLKTVSRRGEGLYHFNPIIAKDFELINENYQVIRNAQKAILDNLTIYIEEVEQRKLIDADVEDIRENFYRYLMGNGASEKYSALISAFVIKSQLNNDFTANLNLIREGVVLYEGIKYTAEYGSFNELGIWTTKLTIYLSTEHLFNALGFNGALFSEIFDDFYQLVKEINHGQTEKKIHLKYFEETWDEVEAFFKTAESIKKGTANLDPLKTAMKAILEGCSTPSDIVNKRVRVELDLRGKGILQDSDHYDVVKYAQYNVEDENILNQLKDQSEKQGKSFDENLCRDLFKIFSKVNFFRRGHSKTSFENIGYIFLTSNKFALYLANNTKVKFDNKDQSFARDLDYITNALWFKLKKGFGKKENTPRSFDVITKAQIILSAQLNNTVLNQYQKLVKDHEEGRLSREEALQRSFELREKPNKPEDITPENIDQSLNFLNNEEYFEDLERAKERQLSLFKESEKEKEELRNELARRDAIDYKNKLKQATEAYETKENQFSNEQWLLKIKSMRKDFRYTVSINIITVLPILIGILLKTYKPWEDGFEQLPNYLQFTILTLLILISAGELFGRSYIFNKPRVLTGWEFGKRLVNKKARLEFKQNEIVSYHESFKKESPFSFPEFTDSNVKNN